uniref:DNA-directed DNA polymerase n=1 Tax=Tanacetum cinerariifolium TaxID=118510 RepID=A0A6L2NJA4_TANCI|nr:DNA-directed DNA polymerase [Tanacetum cinerariifolium]
MNEQLKAEVLTRSSNSSKTSYAVAADLSEMELKKILIKKIESNKHRDDVDKDEEPSAGSDRGSKRRREGNEPESTSAPKEKATKTTEKSTQRSKSHQKTASKFAPAEEPVKTTQDLEEPSHQEFETGAADDQPIAKASHRNYITFVTKTKAADYGYIKWIEDLVPRTMWSQEPVRYDKYALWGISHWGRKLQQFYGFAVNRESARDVYSKHRIIVVTELQIVEWNNYKHLDWIKMRRDDDKLYKFKEADKSYGRRTLCIQHLFKNVHKKHCHPTTYGRSLTRCQKLPKEAQPHKARYVSDGTLNDVPTTLDDRLKGIQMKYLPQAIWRKSDKERAATMIQAIDKQLKTRRIMRSLEKSILMDSQVTPTKHGRMTKLCLSHRFITNCFNVGRLKMEVKKDSILQAGNPVKEILLKLNLPDHKSILIDSKESLKVQDSDKPKGNNVFGPSVFNMVDHNNSFRYNDNKANGSSTKGSMDGSSNSLKGATIQVCKDRCWFKTYESLNNGSTLHIGNELTTLMYGRGYVDLRTDRGGEYVDTLYFLSVGIIYETTVPYTLQHNGISERKTIVLKEMVNSMLSYSELNQGTRDHVSDQHFYCFNGKDDPKTFDEAMKSQDVANLLVANGSSKLNRDGTIKKFKARLVIQGFRQKSGIDYFDTYAPVCMRTRSKSYSNNPNATIPRRSNRRRVPNIVEPESRTIEEVVPMADRTIEELLQAPTEGYGEVIVIPEILAKFFEIKMNLLQLVQTNKFYGFERDNPHTHISNFKRMTSTLKYRDVPNDAIKLMLFPYSLEGAARIWYEKEPPNSILTWDDLVNKFVNQFFPPSKTTHLKNEISRFTQRFEETFEEAWECFKEMLRACPHHGFSELTQIDTFDNGLNEQDQDSLNAAAGGNLLSKTTREALKIIENKLKVRYSRSKSNVSRVNTNSKDNSCKTDDRIDKLADQILNLVEIVNKQVITPALANLCSFFQNQASTSSTLPSNTMPNPKGEMKAVTTRSGLAYKGPSIPTNSPFEKTQPKPNIPYASRLNGQKLREKATNQIEKFFQIFHDLHFDISFTDALHLMPKFASIIKILLTNKDKLFELAKVPLNENCLAMLLKKLPEKLGDPNKFLIPCDFPRIDVCHALADLADRSITHPKGVAEDVFVKVGKFHFPTNFLVVDFEADPRVPLILGRSFLRIDHALIDVYREEIILRYNSKSSNPTMVSNLSIYEETKSKFYFLKDESIPTGIEISFFDPEGDILYLEKLLNDDPFPLPLMDLKQAEETKAKSSIEEPPELELKELLSHLEYAFLEKSNKLPVFIAKDLKDVEKEALIKVLKTYKREIACKISDIKGIDPRFCTHKILIEEDYKPAVQSQRRVNPKIHDVIKKEVIKLFDAEMIYPISDSSWVSPIHCVPKNGGMTVVANENNELILTRLVTGWRVCIDYRKLNDATRKDYFLLPFMDQMLERLAGNEFYCFLDGFSGYFQILIDPQDQEKTTFTCHYGTLAYRRMPFSLCNAPRHNISKSEIEVDREKVDVIAKLPHPTIVKGVRSFLGHAECVDAFDTLKKNLTKAPILVMPDWNLPFELMCDASDFAIGVVLGQRKTKHFQPIHYASKIMTEAQIHYTTTEKEMLAVVYAFEKFRPYLVLSKSIVYTDHSPLKYLLNKQDAKSRLLRWVLLLAIISDRGTHFCNDQFSRVMIKYGVTHRLATAYHPQTSSQVEVSNRGLKCILERKVGENRSSWSDKLEDALWAFRTAFKTPIGCTPYKLVYRKSCHLPTELEHKAYWALKHVNFDLKTAGDHHKLQLNELRDQAYENSLIFKERKKKLHDSKIKNRIFNVGDQVLLLNSHLKIFSGKLKTRWSGPFTITLVFPYGTVEFSQPNSPNFKVNGHRVKHYFEVTVHLRIYPTMIEDSRVRCVVPVHLSFTSFVCN